MAGMSAWITIVGIGDDGLDGISPAARALVDGAEVLVGGARHQAMVPGGGFERLDWSDGVDAALDRIEERQGKRVVVLATGDPMCFGVGATMTRRFKPEDMLILPHPGAFGLAAARMAWSRADADAITVHGRPLETLNLHLAPGARLIALSQDGDTPARAADLLTGAGYGPSEITVMEHLGGPKENIYSGVAEAWSHPRAADLNTLAIQCRAAEGTRPLPRVPGLPDDAFEHDGQITKREVRAVTVSALAPMAGAVLWDVGAGCGSVGIEWLRAAPSRRDDGRGRGAATCVAFEPDPDRAALIARNAAALGVPDLKIVQRRAPESLEGQAPAPDAIFVGGGVSRPGVLEACWDALPPGGRLVANAVTIEAQSRLFAFAEAQGGELIRLAVSRAGPVGGLKALRPMMEVIQLSVEK